MVNIIHSYYLNKYAKGSEIGSLWTIMINYDNIIPMEANKRKLTNYSQ